MGNNWKKQLGEQLKAAGAGRETSGMERTIAAVQEEYGKITDAALRETSLCPGNKRERIRFGEFLLLQIRFTGWKICQISRDKIPFLLCCCAVLAAMTAIPFLQRSLRCRMYETEAASRMSAGKLLASWIVLAGAGDMAGLLMLLVLTVRKTPLSGGPVSCGSSGFVLSAGSFKTALFSPQQRLCMRRPAAGLWDMQ